MGRDLSRWYKRLCLQQDFSCGRLQWRWCCRVIRVKELFQCELRTPSESRKLVGTSSFFVSATPHLLRCFIRNKTCSAAVLGKISWLDLWCEEHDVPASFHVPKRPSFLLSGSARVTELLILGPFIVANMKSKFRMKWADCFWSSWKSVKKIKKKGFGVTEHYGCFWSLAVRKGSLVVFLFFVI